MRELVDFVGISEAADLPDRKTAGRRAPTRRHCTRALANKPHLIWLTILPQACRPPMEEELCDYCRDASRRGGRGDCQPGRVASAERAPMMRYRIDRGRLTQIDHAAQKRRRPTNENALTGVERALFWTLAFSAFAAAAAGLAARAVDRSPCITKPSATPTPSSASSPPGPQVSPLPKQRSPTPTRDQRRADDSRPRRLIAAGMGGQVVRAEDIPPLSLIEIELAPTGPPVDISGDIVAALRRRRHR